ncbi:MAG: alpha/beta fold hydrolase, partial [Gemmatimonadetes bacterium]|nr:alpha/beta fold hydrolase [Gemmatimonadota bacterium]NIQ58048.1 alpha/beta fold hydrolase [Gemmatimonadota bacterium]NIU78231.1 alpha/beta fold hydrolase [Gammaproteobacteria bacterium]NIX47215.1 alpha/beta fold hydrolase [Gemmatimonadota bacterium]NIY11588.1 alpha/beta fold hydrolase [Gemmatimonadota bacterium]
LPAGWRGLAPDLRGFGGSKPLLEANDIPTGKRIGGRIARSDEPILTMPRAADDVADVIEAQADGPVVVCGLSMGGYVALELVRRRPDLVRGLILADTRARADTDEGRENRMRMAHAARTSGARPIAAVMIPTLLTRATLEGEPELVERVRTMIVDTPTPTIVAVLAGMAGRHDFDGELASIDVPTLVVVGEGDRITPPDAARSLAEGIPGAALAVIPDAGHLANLENPDAFNRALAAFLDGLEGRPG